MKIIDFIKIALFLVAVSASTSATATLPTVTIAAAPGTITNGATGTIIWSSTNATTCTASNGWSGTVATSGTFVTQALTQSTVYAISCTGPGGTQTASVTQWVQVPAASAPILTLTAAPTSIAYQGATTLTWTSTNATSCTASGGWLGSQATTGSYTLSAALATATYNLACKGAGGPPPSL